MRKKEQYIHPQAVVVECECNAMLAASELKYTDESADKNLEVLSNGRRGSWGNLWNSEGEV